MINPKLDKDTFMRLMNVTETLVIRSTSLYTECRITMLDFSAKQNLFHRSLQCPGKLSLHFIPQVFMTAEAKSHLCFLILLNTNG